MICLSINISIFNRTQCCVCNYILWILFFDQCLPNQYLVPVVGKSSILFDCLQLKQTNNLPPHKWFIDEIRTCIESFVAVLSRFGTHKNQRGYQKANKSSSCPQSTVCMNKLYISTYAKLVDMYDAILGTHKSQEGLIDTVAIESTSLPVIFRPKQPFIPGSP